MSSLQSRFTSVYEGAPAVRLSLASEFISLKAELDAAGASYRAKIIPPRGRTHRRSTRKPRELVVLLMGVPDGT